MSRTSNYNRARQQLAPFRKGARVLLERTINQRGKFGTVERTVIGRRTVEVRLDEGGSYGAWPENLTVVADAPAPKHTPDWELIARAQAVALNSVYGTLSEDDAWEGSDTLAELEAAIALVRS